MGGCLSGEAPSLHFPFRIYDLLLVGDLAWFAELPTAGEGLSSCGALWKGKVSCFAPLVCVLSLLAAALLLGKL